MLERVWVVWKEWLKIWAGFPQRWVPALLMPGAAAGGSAPGGVGLAAARGALRGAVVFSSGKLRGSLGKLRG